MWIGTGQFVPADAGYQTSLVRIMADAFGMGRPEMFVTLGPSARVLQTPPDMRSQIGPARVLSPAAVQLFHLVLERHAVIWAGGLDCETFHPGGQAIRDVSYSLRDLFLSMFPHIAHVSDFGPLAHPRAPDRDAAA